jgi:hypothetical protein
MEKNITMSTKHTLEDSDYFLIAAAPELLSAAKAGLEISEMLMKEKFSGNELKEALASLDLIRLAIAKAEGNTVIKSSE